MASSQISTSKDDKDDIELRVKTPSDKDDDGQLPPTTRTYSRHSANLNDDEQLQRLGKKPLLNRSFGFMPILGFACSALLSWEGIVTNSGLALTNGGPAGVIWGFLINWIGTLSVNAVLAELSSIAPTAGGQYHWVAMMAPASCSAFLTYLTAWLTTMSWQFIAVSIGYIISTMMQGIIVLATARSYEPTKWQTVLILWGVMAFAVIVNSTTSRALAKFEGLVLVLHLVGFFAVLIPMVYLAPHIDPADVFSTFLNGGGWANQALSFFVGFPSGSSALIGADCAVHMSEEIQHAAMVVPRALMYTIIINGSLAFAMIIVMLICLSDLDAAMKSAETLFYPFIQIFYSAVKSREGACVMAGLILVLSMSSSVGIYASASRMMWSFARDKGLPFSQQLVKLTKDQLPANAIFTTLGITVLLSLIILGSSVALGALISLVVAALFSSYLLSCGLLLWRRCTGALQPYSTNWESLDSGRLTWGPWRVPEPLGTINNVVACLYCAFLLFWSFWPQYTPVTPETMNWSILVFGSVVGFCILWYVFRARHYFKGPIKEI
ncbi:Uu.00g096280.m01.CDS01 [Anthostomella pinea]|uniref:Uu.00g096280.m01.CDS01 n=1 Tax=Anthostomella pinea TaxID=933095 RepID=A0AAI8VC75_9PEZI|nr:Uu.00g096280.m01.CDS01 [Anthostomella pinea]